MTRIREARTKKGLTQQDLAKILNVKQNTISNWESERSTPNKDSLLKMAEVLEVSVDYLLGGDTDAQNKTDSLESEFSRIFDGLTTENKEKVLELARLYSESQKEK